LLFINFDEYIKDQSKNNSGAIRRRNCLANDLETSGAATSKIVNGLLDMFVADTAV